jgi:hypothetical protein
MRPYFMTDKMQSLCANRLIEAYGFSAFCRNFHVREVALEMLNASHNLLAHVKYHGKSGIEVYGGSRAPQTTGLAGKKQYLPNQN